ncbi:hypothetical protein [Streptomyces sp. GSL17-111]|uniref:hypothetical protein n=1 Tax=Streptomyces sp. GSL17-111 TaxID=3121596 RepID=UPI0030F473F2
MNGGPPAGSDGPPDPKEGPVRRLLETPHPPVPPDLTRRAAARGARLLRVRNAARTLAWTVLGGATVFFLRWAAATEPWHLPPDRLTPPWPG